MTESKNELIPWTVHLVLQDGRTNQQKSKIKILTLVETHSKLEVLHSSYINSLSKH